MTQRFHSTDRGLSTLAVTVLLLFSSSIVVFYLNRGIIFEQQTAAHQVRSTLAFETAEAGIEWATGMLNRPNDIQAGDCGLLATTHTSFRRKYIQTGWPGSSNVAVTATTFPGCKVNGTTLYCSCPDVPVTGEAVADPDPLIPNVVGKTLPSFTIAFSNVLDPVTGGTDPRAVRMTATGCTAQSGMCKPATAGSSATTGAADSSASVSVILKLAPTLRAVPAAALTCGTSCNVGDAVTITNDEVASNGYLVNAGTRITSGNGTTYATIPGRPAENALIANDPSLAALSSADPTCTNSAMFRAFFGATLAAYAAAPDTKVIPNCTSASTCGMLVSSAYDDGWTNFYFPDGLSLDGSAPLSVLGTTDPGGGVILVTPASIRIDGNITINGMLFSNDSNINNLGTGAVRTNGAIVTCAAYANQGKGTLRYNSNALGGSGLAPGVMVRVPGSWRDN
jgi:hypothetical protein